MTSQPTPDGGRTTCDTDIARAALTVLRRMACAAASVPYSPPTSTDCATWEEMLKHVFPTFASSTSEWMEHTPALAEVWEWQWRGLSHQEQDRSRRVWKRQLKSFLALHPELASVVLKVAPADSGELPPRPSDQGSSIASAMASKNEDDRRWAEAAAAIDPQLAMQLRKQTDVKNVEFAESMAQMMHDMQMGIVKNIS